MRTTILALSLAATALLAACSDDTTTGSVDATPADDPNAIVVDPAAPQPVPEAPETPVQ